MSNPGFVFSDVVATSSAGTTLPQELHTAATPQFAGLGIAVAGVANKVMMPSGGIIDFNAADMTITHAANLLTVAGGDLTVSGILQNTSSASLANSIGVSSATGFMHLWSGALVGFTASGSVTASALGTIDANISRQGAGIVQVGTTAANASACVRYTNCTNYGCGQFVEMAVAPGGGCQSATLYAIDNGAGKTQLMVVFQTGAAIELAIEP